MLAEGHHSLQAEGAQAKQEYQQVSLPPLRERLHNLRSMIRTQQTKVMLSRIKNRNARATMQEFLKYELQIAA